MASGLPVISTFHAGIPEVIKHDENGFLVQEKDHIAIARYLKILYEDVELAFTIGQHAKQYACSHLDIHQHTTKLQAVYELALRLDGEPKKSKFYSGFWGH
jgi:glycosyltransferase involved in cell wall biosynthesis